MKLRLLSPIVPRAVRSGSVFRDGINIFVHIFKDYGWLKSKRIGRSVDKEGRPIPWFTYPAIDFVKQLDLTDSTVFEYGAGYSTLFWAARAKRVVSIENNKEWQKEISSLAPPNAELILAEDTDAYVTKIVDRGTFDVVVIDGTGESRLRCSQIAPKYLSLRGFIILDNSDLWLESAAALRNANLIQIDFTGLSPLSGHWSTTSIFLSRQYAMRPLGDYQPHRSVAQPAETWPGA